MLERGVGCRFACALAWIAWVLAACGEAVSPPQGQSQQDAALDANGPPRDAQAQPARDAAPPSTTPRDASAAPRPSDAMPSPRDAAMPRDPSLRDDDAGTPADASDPLDASGLLDAGPTEPVACRTDEAPPSLAPCATEGELCAHWRTDPATGYDAYFACNCIAASSTRWVWNCYEGSSGSVQCPHEQPEDGSSCNGYRDRTCPYPPRVRCECPLEASNLRWNCTEPAVAPSAPSSLPASTPVRELDDATRRAFCDWFVDAQTGEGFPAPPEPPPTADGYFPSTGCSGCGGGPGFGGMVPFPLPVSACVANLALSTCEQPLSELVDCVRSMLSECWPTPRGCGRYLEAPGCDGTLVANIVVSSSPPLIDCRIKVR